jgi:hypothetical protein
MPVRHILLAAGLAASATGTSAPMTKEQIKTAAVSDAISIPTPGEFFAAMDDHGQPNWSQMFVPKASASTDSRERMALMLGVLVADGYLEVEAQDGQSVKNTGKEIINLAKKLNVSQSVLGRGNSISDFAENNDWGVLREELEATQNEVKLSMVEQKDKALVILVTVGAWVRGMQVASEFVSKNYNPGLAGLLRQPAIIEYLVSELDNLPEKLRGEPLIAGLREQLVSVLALVRTKDRKPPEPDAVAAIAAATGAIMNTISSGGNDS